MDDIAKEDDPFMAQEDDPILKRLNSAHGEVTPGLNATTRVSLGYSNVPDVFGLPFRARRYEPSIRSERRRKLNVRLMIILSLATALLLCAATMVTYRKIYLPYHEKKVLKAAIKAHAEAAALRVQKCLGIDWKTACDAMDGAAGARRLQADGKTMYSTLEEEYLHSDNPSVTLDDNCLRVYRLEMYGNITFPYHSSQLLKSGGNHTMALFIQHGALRNAQDYFCSFKKLMLMQDYRPFDDILIIAPDFNYEHDELVHPRDAFWNSSKPWGDWRVGAESDPECCGDSGMTVSSFDVLDQMLSILTNKDLFPKMDKISYVGHSAGGQMVQRCTCCSVCCFDAQVILLPLVRG